MSSELASSSAIADGGHRATLIAEIVDAVVKEVLKELTPEFANLRALTAVILKKIENGPAVGAKSVRMAGDAKKGAKADGPAAPDGRKQYSNGLTYFTGRCKTDPEFYAAIEAKHADAFAPALEEETQADAKKVADGKAKRADDMFRSAVSRKIYSTFSPAQKAEYTAEQKAWNEGKEIGKASHPPLEADE